MPDIELIRNRTILAMGLLLILGTIIRFAVMFSRTIKDETSTTDMMTTLNTTTATTKSTTEKLQLNINHACELGGILKGDGVCDDEFNHEHCDYDDGDCCLEHVIATNCNECFCYATQSKHILVYNENFTALDQEQAIGYVCSGAGNGFCEEEGNHQLCDFDGGDCCLVHVDTTHCFECICREQIETPSLVSPFGSRCY